MPSLLASRGLLVAGLTAVLVLGAPAITTGYAAEAGPTATKSWDDGSLTIGLAETAQQVHLTVASPTDAVRELRITDDDPQTFEYVDLTGVVAMRLPVGADRARLLVQQDGGWLDGADPVTGVSEMPLPPGTELDRVTGVAVVFWDSGGALLPADETGGAVDVDTRVRETTRSDDQPIDPPSPVTSTSCAEPSVTGEDGTTATGEAACGDLVVRAPAADETVRLRVTVTVGANPTGADVSGVSFGVRVQCGDPDAEDPEVDEELGVSADRPGAVADVPVGSTCLVWQDDSRGTVTNHPQDAPLEFVVEEGEGTPPTVSVNFVNDFPAVPVRVGKRLTGAAAGLVGHHVFTAEVGCAISTEEGFETVLAEEYELRGGQTVEVGELPASAICWVDETGLGGADEYAVNHPVEDPLLLEAGEPADLLVTNTFGAARLTVRKVVVGEATGASYPMTVTCTDAFGDVTLPAGSARFALGAGTAKVVTVPDGAQCEVTEGSVPAGTTVAYSASDGGRDGRVVVDGTAWVTVTNTVAAASGGSPEPGAPELADTGADTGPALATGLGLVVTGALLLALRRRAPR